MIGERQPVFHSASFQAVIVNQYEVPVSSETLITKRRFIWVIAALSSASLSSCAPGRDLPWLDDPKTDPYHLGTGDQLRITVFGQDQLSDVFRVDEGGEVAIPLIGPVKATGSTTTLLAAKIADVLRTKNLLSGANVTVSITTFRPIFLMGEVARPGQYPYQPGMTMLTAVAVAGGFTYRAVKDYAGVVRTQAAKPERGRVRPEGLIAPGDVITVFERFF
jgi:polysaccharide biosynthesis/export protein